MADAGADASSSLASSDEEDDRDWIEPCASGAPEHAAALAALEDLDQAIVALPLDADPKPLAQRLEALDEERCFAVERAQNHFEASAFSSALALKTFWVGGHGALRARLDWHEDANREIVVAATPRKTLTLESAPGHPLRALLCPTADALPGVIARQVGQPRPRAAAYAAAPAALPCGHETQGWLRRLERSLELRATARRVDLSTKVLRSYGACVEEAEAAPKSRAFYLFSKCIMHLGLQRQALPLGVFKAPVDGWLTLRGRRSGCFDLRAYDLASGAAFVASRCAGNPPNVEIGRLPIETIREAAWAILLAKTAERSVVPEAQGYAVPDGIVARVPRARGGILFGGSYGTSSRRTTLVYQWVRSGKTTATGTLMWPDAHDAMDDYASDLLAIAEAGFVPGAAPARLPTIPWAERRNEKLRVGSTGASFPALDDAELDALEQDLASAATRARVKR